MRTAAPQAPSAGIDLRAVASLSPDEALRWLASRHEGLTTDEADARLRTDGPNRIPTATHDGVVRRLLAQITHFFALLLWAAAILAWIGGMPQLAVAIVLVVLINGAFSFAQEERAERATKALAMLLPVQAVVRRDGIRATISVEELVHGDIVPLREGDRISADARLLRTDGLRVGMATLTGESVPVARDAEPEVASDVAFAFLGPVEAALSMAMLPVGAALWFGWSWGAALPTGADAALLSSSVFSAIVLMQMANAFACRSDPASLFRIGPLTNRLLIWAVGVELGLLLAFVQIPPLARLLGGESMTPQAWLPVLVTPFVFLTAEELRKAFVRGRYAPR